MEGLNIRQAYAQDEVNIIECVNLSYQKYISRLGKKPQPMLDNYALLIAEGKVYVGEGDGHIAGIIVLKDFQDHVLLDNVAVMPSYQGKGIGKSLILFAENYGKQKGYQEIRLYTNIKMEENMMIYKKLGFIEYDKRYEDGYHRVFFRKALQ